MSDMRKHTHIMKITRRGHSSLGLGKPWWLAIAMFMLIASIAEPVWAQDAGAGDDTDQAGLSPDGGVPDTEASARSSDVEAGPDN